MSNRCFHPAVAGLAWAAAVLMLCFVPIACGQDFGQDLGGLNPEGNKHITWAVSISPRDPFSDFNQSPPPKGKKFEVERGGTFMLTIIGTPEKGWHSSPLTRRGPDQAESGLSTLTIEGGANFQPIQPVKESPSEWHDYRPGLNQVNLEHEKPFTWVQEIYVRPTAPAGKSIELPIKIRPQVCDKDHCTYPSFSLSVPVAISSAPPLPLSESLKKRLAVKAAPPEVIPLPKHLKEKVLPPKGPPSRGKSDQASTPSVEPSKPRNEGLTASVLNAILGGFVSLLTPCVFPMIPITVSFFLKQAEKRPAPQAALATGGGTGITTGVGAVAAPAAEPRGFHPALLAAVYSGTIVLVLVAGGLALTEVLQQIISHYVTNFILSALFLFFALSLLGMYDIALPSWLQDKTAAGENKGGLAGVFFMALTFSIVSFACVGPIYGGFLTLTASESGGFLRRLLPVVGFSVAFASPFFVLAMFPSLLKSMPRAGSWMNSVKVVLGFLELAAAVKFLRTGEVVLTGASECFTFDLCLGIYIALSLACGLYLLGFYRLPHDHDTPQTIGVPRLMFGLTFITLGLYLLPGLFKTESGDSQRPRGQIFAWVESFLLPESEGARPTSGRQDGSLQLVWQHKLNDALAEAARDKKLVFIDFTGQACTNCRLNERNVFSRPDVQAALEQHVLVKLYAEAGIPKGVDQQPDSPETIKLRNTVFKTDSLPLYALVKPKEDSFEVVRVDKQGLIRDVPAFIRFLARD